MTHASLFSGIGGFDLAAEYMGWDNIFNCEWEDFPRRVLKHQFPNVRQYKDIHDLDATIHHGRVGVLTGGFPCQPFSSAGKRLGTEDDRSLWPEMFRVVRECQPRWVVAENVRGLTDWDGGIQFEACQADLEAEGYEVQSFILPACAVYNAPHRRDRVWIVAHAKHNGHPPAQGGGSHGEDCEGGEKGKDCTKQPERVCESKELGCVHASDTQDNGCGGRGGKGCEDQRCGRVLPREQEGGEVGCEAAGCGGVGTTCDTNGNGLEGGVLARSNGEQGRNRPQFASTECVHPHRPRLEARRWDNFPTVSPICGRNDGLPKELDDISVSKWRKETIKAYGNAIVPQVAVQIFQAIQETEALYCKA